jgi:Ni,Fe-hydrogenase III small subunit/ferredoxin
VLKILLDAIAGGRVTRAMPGPDEGFGGAAIGRFELADPDPEAVRAAIEICPPRAITIEGEDVVLDEGRCVFCGLCAEGERPAFRAVPREPAVSRDRRELRRRFHLPVLPAPPIAVPDHAADDRDRLAAEGASLSAAIKRTLSRSLHVRHIDAGGCNGCDWELNQLQAPDYDVQRFGVDFVASPRHADVLLVTGVVTRNLELALVRTLDAMPRPRLVVAVGACAISGGIFGTSYASRGGADRIVSVDAYVAGCPPRPWAIIRGLRLALE